tara:strand:- start:6406 stop:7812 length:1407 start_codon:yes stop_codon:yes gene_type:complete
LAESDKDDDWTNYSSAQYGSESNNWEVDEFHGAVVDNEALDYMEENYEITPAPSGSGQLHLIKLGCCDYCLGRIGGVSLLNKSTEEAGQEIRKNILKNQKICKEVEQECCPLCEDLFSEIELISSRLISALDGYEFSTLQLGFQLPGDLVNSEELIRNSYGARNSLSLKQGLSSELSKLLRISINGIEIVNKNPEILVLIDCLTLSVKIDCRSLYLYTRYCKFERGLPQTHWNCRTCKGRGCEKCNETGLQYAESVQSLIADPMLDIFSADSHSTHSMGREDIDVRCLGDGRPTVIELKNPKKRNADLLGLTELVNKKASGKIVIKPLRISNKSEVVRVKDAAADKSYHICFKLIKETDEENNEIDYPLSDEEIISKISELSGVELSQRTPERVSHRRADKIRKRKVVDLYDIMVNEDTVEFKLKAQSGTYIKELVTSDNGRTIPSVAGLLDLECKVEWLDVLDIHSN